MKVKTKISVLTAISSCLFFLTSFVNSNSQNVPYTDVRCNKISFGEYTSSKVTYMLEVECDICELVNILPIWNSDGLFEGTLYEYSLGSEPTTWLHKECQYSDNENHKCEVVVVEELSGGCVNLFVPCTKEDDAECVND